MVSLIEAAARRYPRHIAVHLVAGLGETEREMVERMLWAHQLEAGVSLFAFTPVRGTALAAHSPPDLDVYRRLQAARWLIVSHGARMGDFSFDERGTLLSLALPNAGVVKASLCQVDGDAFCTSGCPGCNRPFYNERPGGPMYNYARPLEPIEIEQACAEMALGVPSPSVAAKG
jgi:biotin synthase